MPFVLAGLAAQTYPAHLLEVVVVDDGNPEPVRLPDVRQANTKLVRVTDGWGRANACHTGARASEGDVIMWLDADMLAFREHVEAQLQWHHEIDYAVVLGTKRFVDPLALADKTPAQVRDDVASGAIDRTRDWDAEETHKWVEGMWRRTDDLTLAGPRAFRAHVGATGSLTRALYDSSGGMATGLRLGEDMELRAPAGRGRRRADPRARIEGPAPGPDTRDAAPRPDQPLQRRVLGQPRADDAAQAQPARSALRRALPRDRPRQPGTQRGRGDRRRRRSPRLVARRPADPRDRRLRGPHRPAPVTPGRPAARAADRSSDLLRRPARRAGRRAPRRTMPLAVATHPRRRLQSAEGGRDRRPPRRLRRPTTTVPRSSTASVGWSERPRSSGCAGRARR
ncbi:glycosyltransferase family 2 protein [Nocardioides sp. B-3]|uniref:glycosyltransferase family 2 protein n=1 Tax=Nocardioides sp. B-3 TaxID=2895565 RepID=UPI00215337F0|nr:glycosyltransferase family 2 protein [Nocardioides sp. B-3]UUZ61219.1 glycosyltransferase [Nocardioides sp. B-3]